MSPLRLRRTRGHKSHPTLKGILHRTSIKGLFEKVIKGYFHQDYKQNLTSRHSCAGCSQSFNPNHDDVTARLCRPISFTIVQSLLKYSNDLFPRRSPYFIVTICITVDAALKNISFIVKTFSLYLLVWWHSLLIARMLCNICFPFNKQSL